MLLLEINGRGSDGWEWKKRNMDGDALKNLNRDGLIINTPRERPPVHSSTSSPGGIRSQERWSFLLLYWKTSSLRKDRITWAQPSVHFFSLCGSSIMNVKSNVMHRMWAYGRQMRKRDQVQTAWDLLSKEWISNYLLYYKPKGNLCNTNHYLLLLLSRRCWSTSKYRRWEAVPTRCHCGHRHPVHRPSAEVLSPYQISTSRSGLLGHPATPVSTKCRPKWV